MGNISSRQDESSPLVLTDQARFSIASIVITNSRNQTVLRLTPNAYPATRYTAQRDTFDDTPIEYVQDPESIANGSPPSFLVRLSNHDDLNFHFTFSLRQQPQPAGLTTNATGATAITTMADTTISGLTYVFASTAKEVDNLIVREFHSDPNLHKNPNVQLVGDYGTAGNAQAHFGWMWKWRPPKQSEDRGGGWRTSCSFAEYNQRAHRLDTLASFSFWVQNTQRTTPKSPRVDRLEVNSHAPRLRVPSTQSIESRVSNVSDSEGEGSYKDYKEPQSPLFDPIPENGLGLIPTMTTQSTAGPVKVDVATCKPGEDPSMNEDGPLFRATMKSLEQKTGHMRIRMKRVLKTAEAAQSAQIACNQTIADFTQALKEASSSNANAVQPALEHYFDKIAKEILQYEKQNTANLQKLIIDPITKLYNFEIKQADIKRREFDEESKEYYAYVGKYLGQRTESMKEKKQKSSDEKYQAKRRTFELKRFDYSSFMHDLHGGRKDQEVLSQLTKYAEAQTKSYLSTAKKVEEMTPQLDALVAEVKIADQDFQLQRKEREEKRRMLETSTKLISEDGAVVPPGLSYSTSNRDPSLRPTESESGRAVSISGAGAMSTSPPSAAPAVQAPPNGMLATPANEMALSSSPGNDKFRGIRDLQDNSAANLANGATRKEGLLWALSRPSSHVDPKGITKPGWHKFWIVLDGGKLSEYVNWKDKLDLHMDPIDLRVASVREARDSDRRFCFEIITPQMKRTYQAPSDEDMRSWIAAINNALAGAFENKDRQLRASPTPPQGISHRKDIAAVLTGKSSSFSGHRQTSNPNRHEAAKAVSRYSSTGDKPSYRRNDTTEAETSALLQRIRAADEGNKFCADCGSENKVDWCSINLGVILCIECGGIHRSLGTHISKVRSLTLDTSAFTPDIIEVLMLVGNRVSNMIWEAKLDRFLKPSPHSTREQRLHFITAKYSERTYVQGPTGTLAPDDFLLTSIKKNDIQSVLHALAQRANPNVHDRSRSTHAIFLALVAADPASPGSRSASSIRVPSGQASAVTPPRPSSPLRKAFPVAELLLQNGSHVPEPSSSPFPLSESAKMYLEFKIDLRDGKSTSAGPDANGDNISPLPNPNHKERERLLKRNSAGPSTSRPRSRASIGSDAIENMKK